MDSQTKIGVAHKVNLVWECDWLPHQALREDKNK